MESCKQQTWLLVYNTYSCHQHGNDKRKTDKKWLLWFSHSLSVSARQLLKPPCTERYARWCERTGVNHPLLLDLTGEAGFEPAWTVLETAILAIVWFPFRSSYPDDVRSLLTTESIITRRPPVRKLFFSKIHHRKGHIMTDTSDFYVLFKFRMIEWSGFQKWGCFWGLYLT